MSSRSTYPDGDALSWCVAVVDTVDDGAAIIVADSVRFYRLQCLNVHRV